MTDTFKEFIVKNAVWAIGIIFIAGGICLMVKLNTQSISGLEEKTILLFKTSGELKTSDAVLSAKLDMIGNDVKEIKGDIKRLIVNRIGMDEQHATITDYAGNKDAGYAGSISSSN